MCGIYGLAFLSNNKIKPGLTRSILRKLSLASQARGTDATGLAFARDNGITIVKSNVKATKFIGLPKAAALIRRSIRPQKDNKLYSIIGHTRAATQGSPAITENNHPINVGSIVGTHNGCLYDESRLFDYAKQCYPCASPRAGQVDSEGIFNAIDAVAKRNKSNFRTCPVTDAITEISYKTYGSFACAMHDMDSIENLWLFRRNNPLSIFYSDHYGLLVYASLERYIMDSLDGLDISSFKPIELLPDSGICINTKTCLFKRFTLGDASSNKRTYDAYM